MSTQPVNPQPLPPTTKEHSEFQLSSFIKITDPKTGQVLVQKRCE
jgi:hypothetical protein